jgi:hypothetical protein
LSSDASTAGAQCNEERCNQTAGLVHGDPVSHWLGVARRSD